MSRRSHVVRLWAKDIFINWCYLAGVMRSLFSAWPVQWRTTEAVWITHSAITVDKGCVHLSVRGQSRAWTGGRPFRVLSQLGLLPSCCRPRGVWWVMAWCCHALALMDAGSVLPLDQLFAVWLRWRWGKNQCLLENQGFLVSLWSPQSSAKYTYTWVTDGLCQLEHCWDFAIRTLDTFPI